MNCLKFICLKFFSFRVFRSLFFTIYVLVFLYSWTNSHFRVKYLTPKEILKDAMEGIIPLERYLYSKSNQTYSIRQNLQKYSLFKGNEFIEDFCYPDFDALKLQPTDVRYPINIGDVERRHTSPIFMDSSQSENGPIRLSPVEMGGHWRPKGCRSIQRVAIVMPHRNRLEHLTILLDRLHTLLRMQFIEYRVFVIEQASPAQFNRAMLLNIGFLEVLEHYSEAEPEGANAEGPFRKRPFDCFVFHDVDLVPEHLRNLYLCTRHVHHLASAIDEMRYHVLFYNYAGGVVALRADNFWRVNGFANLYWGWGNEDDDFSARTLEAGLLMTRPIESIGRFKMARHVKASRNSDGNDLFLSWRARWPLDGVMQLRPGRELAAAFRVLHRRDHPLYTNITVALDAYETSQVLARLQTALEPNADKKRDIVGQVPGAPHADVTLLPVESNDRLHRYLRSWGTWFADWYWFLRFYLP